MPRVMKVQVIRDSVDVAARSQQLGCRIPVRVALLPGNFAAATNAGEFRFHAVTPYIRSAWQSVGLEDEGPQARDMPHSTRSVILSESDESKNLFVRSGQAQPSTIGTVSHADTNAVIPLVAFFGTSLLSGPEWCPTVALSLITRVLALHPACASPWEVRFDAVVERPGTHGCTCIEYQGDVYGIVDLCTDVRRVWAASKRPRDAELSSASGGPSVCKRL
jgi:hypothetical protein